jgi:hypothetical protein
MKALDGRLNVLEEAVMWWIHVCWLWLGLIDPANAALEAETDGEPGALAHPLE